MTHLMRMMRLWFLVNTSFSSVTNPSDLKVSLPIRIREIKDICAHFEFDFESLSSGGDNGCSGLDMSIGESKVQDLSDSVAGSGSNKKLDVDLTLLLEVDVATSIPSHVPAASTEAQAVSFDEAVPTSCPKTLNDFNEKASELNFLELVDLFHMEEGSFIRFEGHNPFCSASITVFLNDNYEEFVRFNIVDVQLSTENIYVPYKYDCRPGYSTHLHATLITNKDCISSTFNSSQFIQCKVAK